MTWPRRASQWDPDHLIVDDELHDLFAQLPQEVLLEVYLDTCHSGTGLKAIDLLLDRKPRYLPPPSLEAFRDMEHRRPREARTKLLEKGLVHHILWAACRANQTVRGRAHRRGLARRLHLLLLQGGQEGRSQAHPDEAPEAGPADLLAGHYTQTPQLEGQATARKAALLTGR